MSRANPRCAWTRAVARCARLRGESGSALVELALICALLGVPLLLGTGELGFVVYDSIEVSNAAHAGALYGMQSLTFAADTAGIRTAAQDEAGDFGTAVTVTPSAYYACSSAIGGTKYTGTNAQSNATAACTGGSNHALEFIQVATSVTVTPGMHCPGLPSTFSVLGSSVMEVEQ